MYRLYVQNIISRDFIVIIIFSFCVPRKTHSPPTQIKVKNTINRLKIFIMKGKMYIFFSSPQNRLKNCHRKKNRRRKWLKIHEKWRKLFQQGFSFEEKPFKTIYFLFQHFRTRRLKKWGTTFSPVYVRPTTSDSLVCLKK